MIDLTYPVHPAMYKYPSDPEVTANRSCAGFDGSSKIISAGVSYKFRNHHGTHIDAPAHKIQFAKTIDQYEKDRFTANAKLIDVSHIHQRNDKGIRIEDLGHVDFEELRAQAISALLFYTGFGDRLIVREPADALPEKDSIEKQFTFMSRKVAQLLVTDLPEIRLVGIDSFSFDPKGSNSETHLTFLERDILLLETVRNCKELSKKVARTPFVLHCDIPRCFAKLYAGADAAQVFAWADV